MLRILVLLMVLVFASCSGGEPTARQESPASEQAAEEESGVPPDEQMVACLNRFREKRYDEAITVCGQALRSNPGDPQIMKAIELSEQALKENGGT
jgi:hypothetical protein